MLQDILPMINVLLITTGSPVPKWKLIYYILEFYFLILFDQQIIHLFYKYWLRIPTGQTLWLGITTSISVRHLSGQVSSLAQSCLTHCDPMDCSMPGVPVHHQLLEFTQTHIHRVSDAVQPSHLLLFPSSLAFNLSQHQCLFQWVSSSHQVAKVLELQLQHQSFQWIFRTNFL